MIDEFKSLEEIRKEKLIQEDLLKRTNKAIQTIFDNANEAAIPLLKKQETIDSRIEDLQLEERVRTQKYKG